MHWRFDIDNPYEDSFEQALLRTADSSHVLEMVKRTCIDIQRDPKANYRALVHGKLVYIAKTGKAHAPDVGALLIVYTLSEREMLIQRLFICKADDVVDDTQRSTMEVIERALRVAIDTALRRASA